MLQEASLFLVRNVHFLAFVGKKEERKHCANKKKKILMWTECLSNHFWIYVWIYLHVHWCTFRDEGDKNLFYRFHCGGSIVRAAASATKRSFINNHHMCRNMWTEVVQALMAYLGLSHGQGRSKTPLLPPKQHICFSLAWFPDAFVAVVLQSAHSPTGDPVSE